MGLFSYGHRRSSRDEQLCTSAAATSMSGLPLLSSFQIGKDEFARIKWVRGPFSLKFED